MIINVTEEDIAEGNKALNACPITLALRRYFGDKISISRNFIRVPKRKAKTKVMWHLIPLPKSARNYLLNYYKFFAERGLPRSFKFTIADKHIKILKG